MYRLSREVRFAVDLTCDAPATPAAPDAGANGYAGKPPVTGIAQPHYALVVTVAGDPCPGDGYITNIKDIDDAVRRLCVPLVSEACRRAARDKSPDGGFHVLVACLDALREGDVFAPHRVERIAWRLTPLTRLVAQADPPMTYLTHTFDFAASHRLHNPDKDDADNRRTFGKCNNPHGHGHNYQFEVSVRGEPDADGFVMDLCQLEQIVDASVVREFDHKHLNLEVREFMDASAGRLNPSVEFIAKVIYDRLAPALLSSGVAATLDAVTVWETAKTWCTYRPSAAEVLVR